MADAKWSKGTPGNRKCVLSIDGGGVRGLIPAQILEYLEECLQELDGPDARIADYFDVVAGTSTGGLISIWLTAPDENKRPMKTAKQITEFYLQDSKVVFPQGFFAKGTGLFGPRYSVADGEKFLQKNLKDLKMEDTLTSILIPTFDVKLQQPVFFTTSEAKANPSKNAFLRDVARGTSAAPTYFAPKFFKTTPDSEFHLVDGGLAANNPSFLAITEAFKGHYEAQRGPIFAEFENLLVLSIGCGNQTYSYSAHDMASWGALRWVRNTNSTPIIDMLMNASADMVDHSLSVMFKTGFCQENFLRIQVSSLEDSRAGMDNVDPANLEGLIQIGKGLLDEPLRRMDFHTGQLEVVPGSKTNRQAVRSFAKWISDECKARSKK